MITNLFLVIFSTLVVPRFARLQSSKKEIRKKIIRIIVILFILSFVIIVTASFFSNQFLWILGKSYKGLNKVFILIIAGGCISMFQGVFFAMNSAKGWIISPVLFIIVSFTTTIVALSLVDVASLEGVIIFTMIVSTVQGITLIGYCFNKISKM
jgi:O-antigen/teichoic acid export membrane protein